MKHKTDWFLQKKWGIFSHYISSAQNTASPSGMLHSKGKGETSWDECVNEFDVKAYANSAHEIGAGYVVFTIMQGARFMCAPNETYNNITGFKTGEACSSRDLIAELIEALNEYDISLIVYYTGDGPYKDYTAGRAFGFWDRTNQNVSDEFVEKWASVLKEYSLRYKDGVKGWWIDGCYVDFLGYDDEKLKKYSDAAKAGNPDTLVAFNNGIAAHCKYSEHEDYTAGEELSFDVYPKQRFEEGSQWHILSFLGIPSAFHEWGAPAWNCPGSKYTSDYMIDYVNKVNSLGGVVSIDVCTFRDGTIDCGQIEVLKHLGKNTREI